MRRRQAAEVPRITSRSKAALALPFIMFWVHLKLFPVEKRSCTAALAAISPTLPSFGRTWLMGRKSGYECNRRFPTSVRSRSESMCV